MNTVFNLSESPSVVDDYMLELRDVTIQGNKERFRNNLRKIGRVLGYEMSREMSYASRSIRTPLQNHMQRHIEDELAVITILRAGLPLHEGVLDALPKAENGFISAYRKHSDDDFTIEVEYVACPNLEGKIVILNDPMLATGQSLIAAWKALLEYGTPKQVFLSAVIASEEGVRFVQEEAPGAFKLWVAAIDPELNGQKYIVPGLGDAGDLSFGSKLQG